MMGFGEMYNTKDIREFLGEEFTKIGEVFAECQRLIDTPSDGSGAAKAIAASSTLSSANKKC